MRARASIVCGVISLAVLGACAGGSDSALSSARAPAANEVEAGSGGGSGGESGGGSGFDAYTDLGAADAPVAIGYDSDAAGMTSAASEQAAGAREPGVALPQTEPRSTGSGIGPSIIKTANVVLQIEDDFSRAVHEATAVAERYGGYVVSTAVDDAGRGFASVTLRVPAHRFGSAMSAVRGVGKVKREEISGEDVTQQLIDLEARLRNLRAQEAVLLRLMDEANSVLETIRIQEHLSDVQLEIERLRGRLRYLDDQVAFSTIFVDMRQSGADPAPKLGIIGRAWQRAVDGALSVVGGGIVVLGFAFPIVVMLALAALAYRMIRVRTRRVPASG